MNETQKKLLELDAQIKASLKKIFGTDGITFGISVHHLTPKQIFIIDDDPKLEQVDHGFGEGNVHYYSSSGHRRREEKTPGIKGLREWTFFSTEWRCTESKTSHSKCKPNKPEDQVQDKGSIPGEVLEVRDGKEIINEDDDENIPCKKCGRTDLPLHIDGVCSECK